MLAQKLLELCITRRCGHCDDDVVDTDAAATSVALFFRNKRSTSSIIGTGCQKNVTHLFQRFVVSTM